MRLGGGGEKLICSNASAIVQFNQISCWLVYYELFVFFLIIQLLKKLGNFIRKKPIVSQNFNFIRNLFSPFNLKLLFRIISPLNKAIIIMLAMLIKKIFTIRNLDCITR